MIARGITLSSASVPATICSIPICMRREAHYVATLMWEEGAGERWGGRGRDEGNGALEARRTARRDFSGGVFFWICSFRSTRRRRGERREGTDGRSKIHS